MTSIDPNRDDLLNRITKWRQVSKREDSEGMDRPIRKSRPVKSIVSLVLLGVLAGVTVYIASLGSQYKDLKVQKELITIRTVEKGQFQEFIPVRGTVMPIQTVFLDALTEGRIEEILVEEGSLVKKGDLILKLSDPNLMLSTMNQEALVFSQISNLEDAKNNLKRVATNLQEQLMEIAHRIQLEMASYKRNHKLWESRLIPRNAYESSKSSYDFWIKRHNFVTEKITQDSIYRSGRMEQIDASIRKLNENLEGLKRTLEDLQIRAPVSGQLTSLDAEIGALRSRGERLGQVDVTDGFKIRAEIDEFYINRIKEQQKGQCKLGGISCALAVKKVYPEVSEGSFKVDLKFVQTPPTEIRRGQSLQIRLELSDYRETLLLPMGGFYHTTGGKWIFALDAVGRLAVRRPIIVGGQNPKFLEILDGLKPGEEVVTSSYENYVEFDRLIIKE